MQLYINVICGKRIRRRKQIQSKINILMNIIITNDVLLWDRDVDRKTKRIITHTRKLTGVHYHTVTKNVYLSI